MRCYFHLVKGDQVITDDMGVDIVDLARAHELALQTIEDIRAEMIQLGDSWQGWRLDVVDPSGTVLLSIPLEPVLH